MKKYVEYENAFPSPQLVSEEVIYVSYVDKGLKFFKTKKEAEDAGKFIAREVTNSDEVAEYKKCTKERRANVYNAWIEDLKNECGYLTASGTFNDAMSFIMENCNCNNKDEIAIDMLELDTLACLIKKGFMQK